MNRLGLTGICLFATLMVGGGCAESELPDQTRDAAGEAPDGADAADAGDGGDGASTDASDAGCKPRTCEEFCGEGDNGCGEPLECEPCDGSLELAPSDTQMLGVDQELSLEARVVDEGGESKQCAGDWTSADPSVAGVSGGVVSGRKAGMTDVRVECAGSSAEVEVHVHDSGLDAELVAPEMLAAWWRADVGLGTERSSVERWRSLAAEDVEVVNDAYDRRPEPIGDGIDGKPVARFEHNEELGSEESIELDEATIFVVGRNTEPGHSGQMMAHCEEGADSQFGFDGRADRIALTSEENDLDAHLDLDGGTTNPHVLTVAVSATSAEAYLNGRKDDEAQVATQGSWQLSGLGALCGADHLEADIAELLVFARTLADEDREAVESYLMDRYGL